MKGIVRFLNMKTHLMFTEVIFQMMIEINLEDMSICLSYYRQTSFKMKMYLDKTVKIKS